MSMDDEFARLTASWEMADESPEIPDPRPEEFEYTEGGFCVRRERTYLQFPML